MAINRYTSDNLVQGGKLLSINRTIPNLRNAVASGEISTITYTILEGDRLDSLAGRYYGDGRLWWVIAAASGIGWWLQVPPGTRLLIPTDLNQVESLV